MDNLKELFEFNTEVKNIANNILKENEKNFHDLSVYLVEQDLSYRQIMGMFKTADQISKGEYKTTLGKLASTTANKIGTTLSNIKDAAKSSPLVGRLKSDHSFVKSAEKQVFSSASKLKASIDKRSHVLVDQLMSVATKDPTSIPLVAGILNAANSMKSKGQDDKVIYSFLVQGVNTTRNAVSESLLENPLNWIRKSYKGIKNSNEYDKVLANTRTTKNSVANYLKGGKPKVSYDDLVKLWKDAGMPVELESVVRLLRNVGYTGDEIRKMMKSIKLPLGQARDPQVQNLARLIIKTGNREEVLNHLRIVYQIKESIITESFSALDLDEETIKKIFLTVVNQQERENKERSQKDSAARGTYLVKWGRELNAEPDKEKKKGLVREMLMYLADRKTQPEWQTMSKLVAEIIKNSGLDQTFIRLAIKSLYAGKVMLKYPYESMHVNDEDISIIFEAVENNNEIEEYRLKALEKIEELKDFWIKEASEFLGMEIHRIEAAGSVTDPLRFNENSDIDVAFFIKDGLGYGLDVRLSEKLQRRFLRLPNDLLGVINTLVISER